MKPRVFPSLLLVWAGLSLDLFAASQTQSLTLAPGWNAVWLEVEPQTAEGAPQPPEAVFPATVDVVAKFLPSNSRLQFLQDPNAESLGADFWLKWRRNTVIGGNTLGAVAGNAAYLVHNGTDAAATFDVTGEVAFHRYRWTPDSYNPFGVPVGDPAPTFSEFFGASSAHPLTQVFKLSVGKWVAVPASERIQKGAAYWVYCKGGSQYQGPVPFVVSDIGGTLAFGENTQTAEVAAGNLRDSPSSLTMERILNGGLQVQDATSGSGIVNFAITADGSGAGTLAPRSTAALRLKATRPANPTTPTVENLYRLNAALSGGSTYYQYLPITASLDVDAPTTTGASLTGLWVGDAIITDATSLVAGKTASGTLGGPRLEPVKRLLRYRVILHADASGQLHLLEHATIMQKRRASEDLPQEAVIVVDDTKIPNFVGIERRGGKLVGERFDTAGYDLPRTTIPPVANDTDPNFNPATLPQTYLLTLPLAGSLAPGGVIATTPGTLVLDPWHRTNPYRHVFNPDHRKGFRIGREMRFELDAAGSPQAARVAGFGTTALSGIFEESVTGLMKSGDTHRARGRFILQQVSKEGELQ